MLVTELSVFAAVVRVSSISATARSSIVPYSDSSILAMSVSIFLFAVLLCVSQRYTKSIKVWPAFVEMMLGLHVLIRIITSKAAQRQPYFVSLPNKVFKMSILVLMVV